MVAVTSPGLVVIPTPGLVEIEGTSPSVGAVAPPAVWVTGRRVQLVIVEANTEVPLMELRGAVVRRPSWRLNSFGAMQFILSTFDEAALSCLVDEDTVYNGTGEAMLIGREAQLWVDGERRWWGPIVSMDVDLSSAVATFQCYEGLWYASRRFMGAAERRDLLEGVGQMDDVGIPGWVKVDDSGFDVDRDVSEKVRGDGSALLVGTGIMYTTIIHPEPPVSTTAYLSGWVRFPAGVPEGTLVATIASRRTGDLTETPFDEAYIYTDSDTPLEAWTPLGNDDSFVRVPTGGNTYITVTLFKDYSGNLRFDEVKVQKNDTTGNSAGQDLVQHFRAIWNHMNGADQADTLIDVEIIEETGTVEPYGIRHVQHDQILDVIQQYTEREDGFDFITDPRRRRVLVSKRVGVDHDMLVLHQREIAGGGWTHDESQRSNNIVIIGDGDGIDRPEGGYTDTSDTPGGVMLSYLQRAASGAPISALDPTARQVHRSMSVPQQAPNPVLVPGDRWADYAPGDLLPVEYRSGVFRMRSELRLQEVTWDLDSDQLELV